MTFSTPVVASYHMVSHEIGAFLEFFVAPVLMKALQICSIIFKAFLGIMNP